MCPFQDGLGPLESVVPVSLLPQGGGVVTGSEGNRCSKPFSGTIYLQVLCKASGAHELLCCHMHFVRQVLTSPDYRKIK